MRSVIGTMASFPVTWGGTPSMAVCCSPCIPIPRYTYNNTMPVMMGRVLNFSQRYSPTSIIGNRYLRTMPGVKKAEGQQFGDVDDLNRKLVKEEATRIETRKDRLACTAMKGKLLTTPSRLLKLLIPLERKNRKNPETTAILLHPQQPLSYLERLIQTELPPIKAPNGQSQAPSVSFITREFGDDPIQPRKEAHALEDEEEGVEVEGEGEQALTRKQMKENITTSDKKPSSNKRTAPDRIQQTQVKFVRWSQNTEIGEFIPDAARAGEFIIAIEGMPTGQDQIRMTVPSFEERTYFLRMRLRKIAGRIQTIARIKCECDRLAHRGAQRVAIGGFGILASWWYIVYRLTFETDLGWDTMEPVTYLVSLSTLMGGYLWFLYHNREISYRSALDFTVSTRQRKLYQLKGVDLQVWENLVDEGNALRKEIKNIAAEYDTVWDERKDERDESVTEALKERDKEKENGKHEGDKSNEKAKPAKGT